MSFLEPAFLLFLVIFVPLYLGISSISEGKANIFVAITSLLFLAWYFPPFSLIIVMQMAAIHALFKEKISLSWAIAFVLAPLFIFKYSAFLLSMVGVTITPLSLPLGISFYTFTAIAVLVEVHRDPTVKAKYSATNSLKILTFWPHLASGPVLRPTNMWRAYIRFRERDFVLAFILIAFGVFKKVVIADGAGAIVSRAMELGISNLSFTDTLYAMLSMSVEIYGDFSGYSDMALGFALLIGIRLPANFNYPYLADSLSDFWRRWHISLTSWFKTYLYIPMGGGRVAPLRSYFNVLIVFLVSGLWHGAAFNFIIWGALHGVLLAVERMTGFCALPSAVRRLIVIPVILISWLVFFLDTQQLSALLSLDIFSRQNNPNALGAGAWLFVLFLILDHLLQPYKVDSEGFPEKTRFGIVAAPVVIAATTILWSEPLPFIYFDF